MAWNKDVRLIIELLENTIATSRYLRGYLDTKIQEGDQVATKCETMMESLEDEARKIRQTYFEQGRLFEKDGHKTRG